MVAVFERINAQTIRATLMTLMQCANKTLMSVTTTAYVVQVMNTVVPTTLILLQWVTLIRAVKSTLVMTKCRLRTMQIQIHVLV
jgi:hypothetical protein